MEEFDEIDEFETVIMIDDETNENIEFAIIDNLEHNNKRYLLVIESKFIDDEEAEAVILKESSLEGDYVTYSLVEDNEEFDVISDLFLSMSDEYDFEIDI